MRGRWRWAVAVVASVALLVGGLVLVQQLTTSPPEDSCVARAGDGVVRLTPEQAKYASIIAAVGVRRSLPVRAVSIALATAWQESGLRNLDHGDRDSLGLFQQRPSQGWGTAEEVRDPVHASNRFYDALTKIPGYREMPITEAAQRVQLSGYPDAYADHEPDARLLSSALTGRQPGALTCTVHEPAEVDEDASLDDTGLTRRAAGVRRELERAFGDLPLGGFAPEGVQTGHMASSAHYDGRAIDIFFRPVTDANRQRGWAVASWLVANAGRLDVATVIFDDRIWRAGDRSSEGWRDYRVPASSSGDPEILEHRDHVHVDVR